MIVDPEACVHKPIFFGVINVNIDEKTIGTVDIWRCGVCKKRFCEEKRLGIETITEIVGMPSIGSDEKWAVTVCKLQKGNDKWKLVKLKENSEVKHECLDEHTISLKVNNYQVEDNNHRSFLVDDHVNQAIEI